MARLNRQKSVDATEVEVGVYCDHQRRTCLLTEVEGELVKYIPLDIAEGLKLQGTSRATFSTRYKLMPDYPLIRAAQLYLNYATRVGATELVLAQLAQFIEIPRETRQAALTARAGLPTTAETVVETTEPSTPVERPARRRAKPTATEYPSAAKMFQALILAGKLTDDEIFQRVQTAFGLEDKKRSYVAWYRKDLVKKGLNPPEAKA